MADFNGLGPVKGAIDIILDEVDDKIELKWIDSIKKSYQCRYALYALEKLALLPLTQPDRNSC